MKDTTHINIAERAGRWLGRVWRGTTRQETRAIRWLVGKGFPARLGRMLPVHEIATIQNVGRMINIPAITKFSNISPKALFNPISGLKLLCGECQP